MRLRVILLASLVCSMAAPGRDVQAVSTPAPAVVRDASFWAEVDLSVLSPSAVTTADFDGDGKPDVAITNSGAASVTLLLSARGVRAQAVGVTPSGIAIGDFNGDARTDLAVANTGSNTVSILRGNGDGTFQAASHFPAGSQPSSIVVADFNQDGHPDVVVSSANGGVLLLGNGNGTLQPAASLGLSPAPRDVVTGDFNGDGHVDIAASFGNNRIALLRGNGNGTFQPRIDAVSAAGDTIDVMVPGDFNGDGALDLAAGLGRGSGALMFLGNGNGTFHAPAPIAIPADVTALTVGDFNHDSKLDLAAATYYGRNGFGGEALVLLGLGDGRLQNPIEVTASSNPRSIAVADLNGDGNADLVIGAPNGIFPEGTYPVGTVSLRFGKGDGTFRRTPGLPVSSAVGADAVAAADFNGDGAADLAIAANFSREIAVVLGNGNGTFQPNPLRLPASFLRVWAMVARDFDGDGRVDLVVADDSGVFFCKGQGDGSLAPAQLVSNLFEPRAVAAADLNGDGKLDLAVSAYFSYALLGNGDGTFQSPVMVPGSEGTEDIAVGDFNGDGVLDVAATEILSAANRVSVGLGNGDGTFQPSIDIALGDLPWSLTAADFNADGKTDLAFSYHGARPVGVLLGTSDGHFQPLRHYFPANPPGMLRAVDLNGDGRPDLAALGANSLSILVGNGDGTFRLQAAGYSTLFLPNFVGTGFNSPGTMAFGDFTNDGRLDVTVVGGPTIPNGDQIGIALLYNITP